MNTVGKPRQAEAGDECVRFLQWALPRLRLRWPGFRKVRGQVCKRVERRRRALGLPDLAAYRAYLESHPDEWPLLDELCRITISRFNRDRGVFAHLGAEVLPGLARAALGEGRPALNVWSAGCASGEEPYTLALLWELEVSSRFPGLELQVLATDVDEGLLQRARDGCYEASSLKEVPRGWRSAFTERGGRFCLEPPYRAPVTLARHDLRSGSPNGPFDLILCRNLAFTYFDLALQREVLETLARCLRPGGALVVGAHESLPEDAAWLEPGPGAQGVYFSRP